MKTIIQRSKKFNEFQVQENEGNCTKGYHHQFAQNLYYRGNLKATRGKKDVFVQRNKHKHDSRFLVVSEKTMEQQLFSFCTLNFQSRILYSIKIYFKNKDKKF